jgi:methyl-accepting chemotaxis protein
MELQPRQTNVEGHDRVHIASGLPPSDIFRIQRIFQRIAPQGKKFVCRFYDVLFERYPEFRLFFLPSNFSQQQDKFLNGLGTLVLYLEHPQELRATLVQLGERHQRYGVKSLHYPPVMDTFLQVLTELAGEGMDGRTYEAWANFLQLIRTIMLEGYALNVPANDRSERCGDSKISDSIKRILLIDDDHQLLELYQSYLESQGYHCSPVSDVDWAFTHLQMSHYDVVLTDFQMPVMNGIELREKCDFLNNGACPPFVLVTGNLSQEIRKIALASGFVGVIKKPHDLIELVPIIQSALNKS